MVENECKDKGIPVCRGGDHATWFKYQVWWPSIPLLMFIYLIMTFHFVKIYKSTCIKHIYKLFMIIFLIFGITIDHFKTHVGIEIELFPNFWRIFLLNHLSECDFSSFAHGFKPCPIFNFYTFFLIFVFTLGICSNAAPHNDL